MDECKVIVVQMDCLMARKEIEHMRKELIEQMADGIVVVPGYAHVEYVGKASDVVIVDKNNIDDLVRMEGEENGRIDL